MTHLAVTKSYPGGANKFRTKNSGRGVPFLVLCQCKAKNPVQETIMKAENQLSEADDVKTELNEVELEKVAGGSLSKLLTQNHIRPIVVTAGGHNG